MDIKGNQNTNGLNLDSLNWQIQNNQLTWALNANVMSHDGNTFTYTNEMSNQICVNFETLKPGYTIVGLLNIIEQDKVVVFLSGPGGKGEIGVISSNGTDCIEVEQVETDCGCIKGKVLSAPTKLTYEDPIVNYDCPDGYKLVESPPGVFFCEKKDYTAVSKESSLLPLTAVQDTAWGFGNPSLYSPGWNIGGWGGNGSFGSGYTKLTNTWWRLIPAPASKLGRVNQIAKSVSTIVGEWFSFTTNICIEETKTYYFAIAADDFFRVRLDGNLILDPANIDFPQWQVNQYGPPGTLNEERISYMYLHIYPIQLTRGGHTLQIEYLDMSNPGMIAAEIYDNTAAELIAATGPSSLNIIWSTQNETFIESIKSISCPPGYTLMADSEGDCGLVCGKIAIAPATPNLEANSCCKYEPVLIDECCQDCCPECVGIQFILKPAYSTFQVSIEWIDCDGNPQYNTFGSGSGPVNVSKDTWKYVVPSEEEWVQSINYIPLDTDCDPCLEPNNPVNCCLNFDIENPVYATYRIDQCETRIYFVDRKNPPRYLSLEFPLNRDACGKAQDCNGKKLVTKKSCGELKIFPDTCHPRIYPDKVSSGGELKAGTYQFAIAYCDENGAEFTDFFDFTQPLPIYEKKLTNLTDYVTNYSIRVKIEHQTNIFDYFKLIVAETIQGGTFRISTVGIYKVEKQFLLDQIVFTGAVDSVFATEAALARTPYYNTAGIVEHQNDILMLADLEKEYQYNFQPFANKLKLYWETVNMPVGGKFDYSNPEIAYFFRTYQRDEVYAFGIKFKLKSGKYTEVFHIPGRAKNLIPSDSQTIPVTNQDNFIEEGDCKDPLGTKEGWQVYNTAYSFAFSSPKGLDYEQQYTCEIGAQSRGDFAYWESTEKYPCNEDIWDEDAWGNKLADTPLRFHKFPDSSISHIHSGFTPQGNAMRLFDAQKVINPIGVRVDADVFNNLLNTLEIANPADPTKPFKAKDLICGFELVRATRVNNKSVVAKGLVYDVGTFTRGDGKTYYYPNYPFNDIGWRGDSVVDDPYLRTDDAWYDAQRNNKNIEYRHRGFVKDNIINYKHQRFTFHSPDTHFAFPKIGSELRLETVEFGQVLGHFVNVEEHSETRLYTERVSDISTILSALLAFKQGSLDLSNFLADRQQFISIIEKLVPRVNYAWQYNGIGMYNNYRKIGNLGNKRRRIKFGNYASSDILNFGEGEKPFHNRFRESSVYLSLENTFNHEASDIRDTSKYIASERYTKYKDNPGVVDDSKVTRAYYASIKDNIPNQYGQLSNIKYVSTGYTVNVNIDPVFKTGSIEETYYPAFGGDTYINQFTLKRKHAFFRQNYAGKPNDLAGNYQLLPNLGYPAHYYGMRPEIQDVGQIIANFTFFLGIAFVAALVTAAAVIAAGGSGSDAVDLALNISKNIIYIGLLDTLGDLFSISPSYYLDRNFELRTVFYHNGMIYLFSYGMPVFFVESDVNVDFRHGRNDREENFYRAEELAEIPDDWLQEIRVPIKFDNFYYYNIAYSVQNILNPNPVYNETMPEMYCETDLYNRVIYSDMGNKYLKSDPWLNYRRNNFYDFPKTSGKLIALNAVENNKVYARFENSTKLYNAIITLDSNNPQALELGNASMFNQKPIDLSTSDTGYLGSQHKAFIKTTHGGFWVDARRGHIYQVSGSSGVEEISNKSSMNWFKEYLPFQIIKDIPNFPIDNTFKGIGITMGWDERFHRLFVTKLDYRLKPQYRKTVTYENKKLYYNDVIIELGDPTYFENKSWTASYSVLLKAWISFHSFLPNNYIGLIDHFQTVTKTGTWNHNLSPFTYQTYYNKFYPYIIEFAANAAPNVATINAITYYQDIHKYYNRHDYYSLGSYNGVNTPNFTKAIIYNKEQTSGVVKLVAQVPNDARQMLTYPRVSGGAFETLLTKREHRNTFNGFWDATNNKLNNQPLFSTEWSSVQPEYPIDKVVNTKAVIYNSVTTGKQRIRSTFARVRLIQDLYNRYKFINNIQLSQINNSII
jgi:hypothetical protein